MKFRIHLAAVTLLSGLTAPAFAADPQNITSGHRYYEKICAKCHEAGVGPNLKGRGLPPSISPPLRATASTPCQRFA